EILYGALNSTYDQPQNLNDENEFKSQDISKTNKDSQTLKDQSLKTEKNSSEFKSIILKKPNKNGKITKKSKKVTAHSQEEYDKYISEGYTDNYERDIDDYEQFSLLS
ncbi:MAG: hypothetical protein IJU40_00410, partial [Desulfovibrionaceae bacterium]|nr:hypothetical protein [Desulfovibrionaceae bacterium]